MNSKRCITSFFHLALILITLSVNICFAQIEFQYHSIDRDFQGVRTIHAADVDGDGDTDVLGAAYGSSEIAWWENDGDQGFDKHVIDDEFEGAHYVYAADIDGDGDMDVAGAAILGDEIAWWENDGDQEFEKHVIGDDFSRATSVYVEDVDGDGDMDVLGTARDGDDVTWWENDGDEDFTEHVIDGNFDGARHVYVKDIDNDEDMDVLAGAINAGAIAWWENDGEQEFEKHFVSENVPDPQSNYAFDIDGDGDIDILGCSRVNDDVIWWENNGEQEFRAHWVASDFDAVTCVYAADMDNDGDVDILGAARDADDITWWENDGEQNFEEHIVLGNFDGARSVFAIDIDGDRDLDIVGAAVNADDVAWWENNLDPMLRWEDLPVCEIFEDSPDQLSNEFLSEYVVSQDYSFDDMELSVENGEHVSGEINEDGLQVIPDENWNGEDALILTVTDPDENSAVAVLELVCLPVNDPPESFCLVSPENETEINDYAINFDWDQAQQNEWEQDDVNYNLHFQYTDQDSERTYTVEGIEASRLRNLSIDTLANRLGLDLRLNAPIIEWRVTAYDDSFFVDCDEPFTIILAPTPFWQAFPDTCLSEDGSLIFSSDYLFSRICYPDFPWESLDISVENGDNITGEMTGEGLNITVTENWNGLDSLVLTMVDPNENSDEAILIIDVLPVNDSPGSFSLLSPADGAELNAETVSFYWETAEQNEWEIDEVHYNLHFQYTSRDSILSHTFESLADTVYPDLSVDSLFSFFGLNPGADDYTLEWRVAAYDDSFQVDCGDSFTIILPFNTVGNSGRIDLPDEITLSANYPNPFNSETTIRFGLPHSSEASITILDKNGRIVKAFDERRFNTGYHFLTWNASSVPTGMYFIRLETDRRIITRKITLIK